MSHPLTRRIHLPAALLLAVAAAPVAGQEAIQIPGLNLPVAASVEPDARPPAQDPPGLSANPAGRPGDAGQSLRLAAMPGTAENPSVPASVVRRPSAVVPVESRQDVLVANGTNTLIPISRGQINRIVTPFDNPHVQTVSAAEIATSDNVIYVTTQAEQPVTMFITPEDDESVAISLTLLPQNVPPIQANLVLATSALGGARALPVSATSHYRGEARKWERAQPYMDTLRSLLRDLALGKLPRGYNFGALASGDKVPACAQPSLSFDFSQSQFIEGHDLRVYVATAENVSATTVEFDYGACTHPHRAAVSTWPVEILEPGQKTEVFVVTRIPSELPQSSTRPSLLH